MSSRFEKTWATEVHRVHLLIQEQRRYELQIELVTRTVREAVQAAAPDATGYYKRKVRRRGNRVIAGDRFWHLVEYGSIHNPPYAPLRRGVLAVGLRLDETPPM